MPRTLQKVTVVVVGGIESKISVQLRSQAEQFVTCLNNQPPAALLQLLPTLEHHQHFQLLLGSRTCP